MANPNKPETRKRDDSRGITINVGSERQRDDDGKDIPSDDQQHLDTQRPNEEGSDEGEPSEAEIRAAELKTIDETEISDEAETTTLYRRAVSDFDPNETEVQLAEHWVYRDEELERDGYF